MTSYSDPVNAKEIISEINDQKTLNGVMNILRREFPKWEVCVLDGFCTNYPHLDINWTHICNKIEVQKAKILLVEHTSIEDDHSLIRYFIECLIQSGFCVRNKTDYVPCRTCENIAVPTPPTHTLIKENNIIVPNENMPYCGTCRSKVTKD